MKHKHGCTYLMMVFCFIFIFISIFFFLFCLWKGNGTTPSWWEKIQLGFGKGGNISGDLMMAFTTFLTS